MDGETILYIFGCRAEVCICRCNLVQEMNICDRVLNVGSEVGDLAATRGVTQMIVDPADEDLLRRELHELLQCLTILEQHDQSRILVEIDVTQKSDLPIQQYVYMMYKDCNSTLLAAKHYPFFPYKDGQRTRASTGLWMCKVSKSSLKQFPQKPI